MYSLLNLDMGLKFDRSQGLGPLFNISQNNKLLQYTEEKMGKAERTPLDPHLVELETKTDNMRNLTDKLKNNSAAVLVPNPGKLQNHIIQLI